MVHDAPIAERDALGPIGAWVNRHRKSRRSIPMRFGERQQHLTAYVFEVTCFSNRPHSMPSPSPMTSRADWITRTVPAGAALVTRLAILIGLPYQSPARFTA
jgi:hypothetical protein